MRFPTRFIVLSCLVVMLPLAGCSVKNVPWTETNAKTIHSLKVVSWIPQATVAPAIYPSHAGAAGIPFGAIGAIIAVTVEASIDSSRDKKAEEKIKPLAEIGRSLNVPGEFLEGLKRASQDFSRIAFQELVTQPKGSLEEARKAALSGLSEDAALLIATDYYLSPDFKVFSMRSQAEIWDKTGKTLLYKGEWDYHSPPKEGEEEAQRISAWTAENGAPYFAAVRDAIEKTDMMLRLALTEVAADTESETTSISYAGPGKSETMTVEGPILKRLSGSTILKDKNGNLHAFPSPAPQTVTDGSPAPAPGHASEHSEPSATPGPQ